MSLLLHVTCTKPSTGMLLLLANIIDVYIHITQIVVRCFIYINYVAVIYSTTTPAIHFIKMAFSLVLKVIYNHSSVFMTTSITNYVIRLLRHYWRRGGGEWFRGGAQIWSKPGRCRLGKVIFSILLCVYMLGGGGIQIWSSTEGGGLFWPNTVGGKIFEGVAPIFGLWNLKSLTPPPPLMVSE